MLGASSQLEHVLLLLPDGCYRGFQHDWNDNNDPRAALEQDLAVAVRVRNRLAQTGDAQLPHVLQGLLPRLLRRLDANALALYGDGDDGHGTTAATMTTPEARQRRQQLRAQIQAQLLGCLSHCSERVRGGLLTTNKKNNTESSTSWVEAVLKDLNVWQSSVTLTVALSLLETAFPSVSAAAAAVAVQQQKKRNHPQSTATTTTTTTTTACCVPSSLLPPLVEFLDGQYRALMMLADEGSPAAPAVTESSSRLRVRTAGWLLLDAIAMLSGMQVFTDWDLMGDHHQSIAWDVLEEAPSADAATRQLVAKDGCGVLDLVLDVSLFWPAMNADLANGLSVEGLARINHKRKGAAWDELHLRQLKYAILRYALGTPNSGGLGPGLLEGDRALLVAVLTASGNSMHGRLAVAYLNQIVGMKQLVRNKQDNKKWTKSVSSCSLSLAVSLLVLMLGDADAAPVLADYSETSTTAGSSSLWTSVLGPRPKTDTALFRSPLPMAIASKGAEFLLDHFRPDVNGDREGLRLFFDLVVVLQDPSRHGVHWGIQLMHNLYCGFRDASLVVDASKDEWVEGFYRKCLQTAISVLKTVPSASEVGEMGDGPGAGPVVGLPGGVPQPFRQRRDLDTLLRDHRLRQQRSRLQMNGAVKGRQVAYQMIAELANERTIENNNDDTDKNNNKFLYEIPIVLFQCASAEDEKMQAHLSRAMETLLSIYKKMAKDQPVDSGVHERTSSRALAPLVGERGLFRQRWRETGGRSLGEWVSGGNGSIGVASHLFVSSRRLRPVCVWIGKEGIAPAENVGRRRRDAVPAAGGILERKQ